MRRLRWPEGFQCPRCHSGKAWTTARGLLHCEKCGHQTSLTAGTLFEGTRKPLRVWFQAAWYLTNQKFGVSALGLKRILGLGSYQTAWTWLHKLRRAMVRPGRDLLTGRIEVDETYIGGNEEGVFGRQLKGKSLVVIALETMSPKGFGRVRLRQVPDASGASLSTQGYHHERRIISGSGNQAHFVLPGPHRIASLLKRWLLGTHHGAVRHEHLEYYLDEYTFRFNRRRSRARGLLFHRLIEQAVNLSPATYGQIIGENRPGGAEKGTHNDST